MEFFLEVKDSHDGYSLDSSVEIRFKAPPGTSYSYITIISTSSVQRTEPHGRPNLRSRLHFDYNRAGRPRSPYGTCCGIGGVGGTHTHNFLALTVVFKLINFVLPLSHLFSKIATNFTSHNDRINEFNFTQNQKFYPDTLL
jgi:hypothetical protein